MNSGERNKKMTGWQDDVAVQNSLTYEEIIKTITLGQVENFLRSLGVMEIEVHDDYLICPTICHNPIDQATSMKLYYYDETKNFHCYTQCSENLSIITLYRRYMELNHSSVSYDEAAIYVRQFVSGTHEIYYEAPKEKKEERPRVDFITLPAYDEKVLDVFQQYDHPLWIKDGITHEAQRKFGIRYSISQNKIIIPHYDIDGRLVGIRARAINPEDIAIGKYMPIKIEDTIYAHKLGFNLYGIYEHQEAMRILHHAIIYESEKSVMLDDEYFGESSTAVATCGSQLNRFQINLLVKKLGVSEIILAFDKEFVNPYDEKGRKYRQKLIDKCKKYQGMATFYYIFDEHGLLQEKDAPCDRGKETLLKLLERKILIV